DANREMASLARKYEAYKRQSAEASSLVTQAKSNLDLFQKQYDGGQRKVMEVVGVYETYIRALETALEVKYKAARAELRIAELQGVLASGDRI
ncbi:MAG: TolC family protein, partial [Pseudomonadota bacterium]|nr:TolC family protein [Pseudomonadota bacterium]